MINATANNLKSFYSDMGILESCSFTSHLPFYAIQCPTSSWPNLISKDENIDLHKSNLQSLTEKIRAGDYPKLMILGENDLKEKVVENLTTNGFKVVGKWANMELKITQMKNISTPENFKITVIDDNADDSALQEWISIVQMVLFNNKFLNHSLFKEGIKKNIFKLLIGSYKGEAACTTLLYSGTNAGIFMVATLPAFQKNGLGKAMMLKTQQLAWSLNYSSCFLQSTTEGLSLYQSLGYKHMDNSLLFYFLNN